MTDQARPPLQPPDQTVRTYRVRAETCREVLREGDRRRTSALEVKLWATLARGDGRLPGAPGVRQAVLAVLHLASAAVTGEGQAPLGELEPFRSALYDSHQHPGCDELFVSIRLPLRFGEDGAEDEGREARLRELKRRLEALGVFEGRWKPRPEVPAAPPTEAEADPWQVRAAAAVFAAPPARPGPAAPTTPGAPARRAA